MSQSGASRPIDVYAIKSLASWQSNFSLDQERTQLGMKFYDKCLFGQYFKETKTSFYLKSSGGFVNVSKIIKHIGLDRVIHSCFIDVLIVLL